MQTDGASPVLSMAGLGKTYGQGRGAVEALGAIDLEIRRGEFVSVVGPSGCGKSTLLKLAGGLEAPSRGTIAREGRPLDGPTRQTGIIFQEHVLFPWLSILENVTMPAEVAGHPAGPARARALELLAMAGLADFAGHRPAQLSGGMKQRAAFCRALIADPGLLLMDEPFGALDALTREELSLDLSRMWQDLGRTALLITHDIEEAILLGDRVLVMSPRPGRILADIPVPLPRPRSVETAALPEFHALKQQIRSIIFSQRSI
ncbi:ABC transporter ATP-binding protein [Poseidonocella sp. HB161398]|uniref:ABC transporter ATP-binding protein n=1 Tax=Poseidonocella sp. HB161398 TaxID=2320855 RepID=UPI0019803593|nr:ABC transporter ATP-binding protein [Poseidonocella sp. HB161398]